MIKSIPYDELISIDNKTGGTVLDEVIFNRGKLTVTVLASIKNNEIDTKIKYIFDSIKGILLLDEGDLITLWETKQFWTGHIIYKLQENTIFEKISEIPGVLSVSLPMKKLEHLNEWLICSADDCILVLTNREPKIEVTKISK